MPVSICRSGHSFLPMSRVISPSTKRKKKNRRPDEISLALSLTQQTTAPRQGKQPFHNSPAAGSTSRKESKKWVLCPINQPLQPLEPFFLLTSQTPFVLQEQEGAPPSAAGMAACFSSLLWGWAPLLAVIATLAHGCDGWVAAAQRKCEKGQSRSSPEGW